MLAAAWCGLRAYQVNQDLADSVDAVRALQRAVESGDSRAADAAYADLKQSSGSAADRTGGPTWSLLEHLPSLGDDARGVAVVSGVVDDLSRHGIESLIDVSDDLDAIVPQEGRIDPATIQRLQGPVASAHHAFADADRRLSAEDSSGYVERLRIKYRDLASRVDDAARALDGADKAVQVLPSMLGVDGAKNYLLVFQNNAEIRATGGLPGAVSLLHAKDGKVAMTRQVAAGSFGYTNRPVLPLTRAEEAIWGDGIGRFFLNANVQPDFARASDLWRARWEQVYPERLDGVVSIDPVAISYILDATGPLEVDGTTLTSDNAVDELLHQVYLRYAEPADQDTFFRAVASAMFDRVSAGVGNPRGLIKALSRGAREHRVYVHAFDPAVEQHLAGTPVDGSVAMSATKSPQVGVYLSDATGAKMSYFLRYRVSVDATYCTGGTQGLSAHMSLQSDAPDDAATLPPYVTGAGNYGVKPGSQLVFVRIFGPVDGTVTGVALNGRPIRGFAAVLDGTRKVFTAAVQLRPQERSDLTWRMRSGKGQTGDTKVSVTPSVMADDSSTTTASACS